MSKRLYGVYTAASVSSNYNYNRCIGASCTHTVAEIILFMGQGASRARTTNLHALYMWPYPSWLSHSLLLWNLLFLFRTDAHNSLVLSWVFSIVRLVTGKELKAVLCRCCLLAIHLIWIFPKGKPFSSHRQLYLAMTSVPYRIVSYMKNHRTACGNSFNTSFQRNAHRVIRLYWHSDIVHYKKTDRWCWLSKKFR